MKVEDLVRTGVARVRACVPALREGATRGADVVELAADATAVGQEAVALCNRLAEGAVKKATGRRVARVARGLAAASDTLHDLAAGVRRIASR